MLATAASLVFIEMLGRRPLRMSMAAAQAVAFLGIAIKTEIGGDDGAKLIPGLLATVCISLYPLAFNRLGVNPLALPRRSQLPQHADQRRRSRNCDGLAVKLRCRADHVHWHALPSLGPVNNLRNPQRSLRANCLLPD